MGWFEAILLGFVQGLTEFLPISSSAHLRIVAAFLPGSDDPGAAFTAVTQLGTELAVLLFFRRDIARIVTRWVRSLRPGTGAGVPRNDPEALLGWWIIIGSVPIVLLGLLFQDAIETTLRSLWLVASALIVFGVILGLADAVGRKTLTLGDMRKSHAIVLGCAQALALIPGVSRSGGTISAGLLLGFTRAAAARYSFLLAIPAVFGSGLYSLKNAFDDSSPFTAAQIAAATIVAFVVGFIVIAWLMRYISHRSFLPFVLYRIVLGAALLILLATGVVAA